MLLLPTSQESMHNLIKYCHNAHTHIPSPQCVTCPSYLCHTDVRWTEDALQCEGYELWLHRIYMNVSSTEYGTLGQESSVWFCGNCRLRNTSSTLFRMGRHDSQATHDSSSYSLGSMSSHIRCTHLPLRKYSSSSLWKVDLVLKSSMSTVTATTQKGNHLNWW